MASKISFISRDNCKYYLSKAEQLIRLHPLPCALGATALALGAIVLGAGTFGAFTYFKQRSQILDVGAISANPPKISPNYQEFLEQGIQVTEEMTQALAKWVPMLGARSESPELRTALTKITDRVFKLNQFPNVIFKLFYTEEAARARFQHMVDSLQISLKHRLDRLVIPHAKMITVETEKPFKTTYRFIVEEYHDLKHKEWDQENLYMQLSSELDEAVEQIAQFTALRGFIDVSWRNIPLRTESPDYRGPRTVILVDLEDFDKSCPRLGFIGDPINDSRGLIRCLSRRHIPIALKVAAQFGIEIPESVIDRRIDELPIEELSDPLSTGYRARQAALSQFYQERSIRGQDPLSVDLDSLGLNLAQNVQCTKKVWKSGKEGVEVDITSVREVTEKVIGEINRWIKKDRYMAQNPLNASVKKQRYLFLNPKCRALSPYESPLIDKIISALVTKGYLFKVDKVENRGYLVQA